MARRSLAETISTNLDSCHPPPTRAELEECFERCIADMRASEEREPLVLVLVRGRLWLARLGRKA